MNRMTIALALLLLAVAAAPASEERPKAGEAALGAHAYDDFETPDTCAMCHVAITRQHEQAMMSRSFVHEWDEIEYYELALPHSLKEPKVAGIKAGCNGCHAPLAFLAGDIPPKRPAEGTRANEGVSCDVCHTMVGFQGDVPYNFNYIVAPGETKFGRRGAESPGHGSKATAFYATAEFCGTCHNEKDPFGMWVKATHLEWKEGPYAAAGIVCQDCHMPPTEAWAAEEMGERRDDVRQHLFHGAHDAGKLAGVIEVRIHPDKLRARPGERVELTAVLVNGKAGHMVPTGSAEERLLWLHVTARDAGGTVHHLPVDRKGFEGEDYTIASDALAYQDIGDIKGLDGFAGLGRDGNVPAGDRIFRLPYLDPQGRMTIAQWNTAGFGPDYRLPPLRAVRETFGWKLPAGLPAGDVEVTAEVFYALLVSSVADYLGVPAEESAPVLVNRHRTRFTVVAE